MQGGFQKPYEKHTLIWMQTIKKAHEAGAKIVVIGNKIEDDVDFLLDINNYRLSIGL